MLIPEMPKSLAQLSPLKGCITFHDFRCEVFRLYVCGIPEMPNPDTRCDRRPTPLYVAFRDFGVFIPKSPDSLSLGLLGTRNTEIPNQREINGCDPPASKDSHSSEVFWVKSFDSCPFHSPVSEISKWSFRGFP
jgi:hypothetical protein